MEEQKQDDDIELNIEESSNYGLKAELPQEDNEPNYVIDDGRGEFKFDRLITDNDILTEITKDRNGNPMGVTEMRQLQNRLMNRPADFAKWGIDQQNDYLLRELSEYHLNQLPPLEELKALHAKQVTPVIVDNDTNIHALDAPRVNIKAEHVALSLVSDGKTITFNNRQALEDYRAALAAKNEIPTKSAGIIDEKVATKQVDQQLGEELHQNRKWE